MKMPRLFLFVPAALILFFALIPLSAFSQDPVAPMPEDMREDRKTARNALLALEQQAGKENETAREEARRSRERITGDRTLLKQEIARLEETTAILERKVADLEEEEQQLNEQETALSERLAATDAVVRELVGVIRVFAKDISSNLSGSLQSAVTGGLPPFLDDIADGGRFPGIEEITRMVDILWNQTTGSGNVRVQHGQIIDRTGKTVDADILVIGDFTAAYRTGDEIGYLQPSPTGSSLFALANLPPRGIRKQLASYMEGKTDSVPLDISRGGAIGQLAHSLSQWRQIEKGGLLIWPILAIFLAALLIVVERLVFLWRTRLQADTLVDRIAGFIGEHKWESCHDECRKLIGKPLARVLNAGLSCCQSQREIMENALQEAILREIPPLERFLSTLGMLAAIAPLLGLLGTVTGMISVFNVITRYGTGDPRMMSGGISEALVTTMLGLSVAIPIMLVHTLLNRTIDKRIAAMEEKAMTLVNLVQKNGDTPE